MHRDIRTKSNGVSPPVRRNLTHDVDEPPLPEPSTLRTIAKIAGACIVVLAIVGQAMYVFAGNSRTQIIGSSTDKGTFRARISEVLFSALGESDRNVRRFRLMTVTRDRRSPKFNDVVISWSINNDVSEGTVGNGARADVFAMLYGIYSSRLPVAQVTLVGTYPLKGSSTHDNTAMKLRMGFTSARLISEASWESLGPAGVWPLLDHLYVAPDLAPVSTE